jgi:hypothetical protein
VPRGGVYPAAYVAPSAQPAWLPAFVASVNVAQARRRLGVSRRPNTRSRASRRVRGAGRVRSASNDPPGEPEPPPSLRRLDGGVERSRDSRLNQCWQLGLVLGVEELRTLVVLAETRAVWLARWDVAA